MTDRLTPRGLTRLKLAAQERPVDVGVLAGAVLLFDVTLATRAELGSIPFALMALPFITMPLLRLVTVRWRPNHSSEADLHGVQIAARRALVASVAMVGLGAFMRSRPSSPALGAGAEALLSVWWLLSAIETIAISRPSMRLHPNATAVAATRILGHRLLVAICGGLGIVPAIITNTSGIAVAAITAKYAIEARRTESPPGQRVAAPEQDKAETTEVTGTGRLHGPTDDEAVGIASTSGPSTTLVPTSPTLLDHSSNLQAEGFEIQLAPRGAGCSATIWTSNGDPPHVLDPLVLTQVTKLARMLDAMFEIARWSEMENGRKVTLVVTFHGHIKESTVTYDRTNEVLTTTSPASSSDTGTTTVSPPTTPVPSTTAVQSTSSTTASLVVVGAPLVSAPVTTTTTIAPATTTTVAPATTTTVAPTTTTTGGVGLVYLEAPTAPATCDAIRSILAPLAEKAFQRPR